MKNLVLKFLVFFVLASISFQSSASHMVGSDISYSCTSTPGVWHVKIAIYRDCSGISLGNCTGNCGTCNYTLNWQAADPGFTNSGNFSVSLTSVTDVNPNPRCPSAKSICTDNGCVTAGTYTPGVEKYLFEGDVDLGSSILPASCCNVRVYWSECCRNGAISTGSAGENFYIDALINRCTAANNPCNSSPELSNDPFAILCGGQAFVYNNGAIDPDHDSLTFAFAPALSASGTSVTYNAPYTYDAPMPYGAPIYGPFPLGIHCDPQSGDIMFTPSYGIGSFVGVMAIEIKQWRTINGVITNIGTTRRDIQMWLISCPSNHPPRIMTDPSSGNLPKLSYQVCAGQQLCFYVIGKDTDYLPQNTPPISDTTYLSWNGALASKGATFLPTYSLANRTTNGPREDKYQFCWTPNDSNVSSIPYYITVRVKDSQCPNPGQSTRAISILVVGRADVSILKNNLRCGNWSLSYYKNKPSQTFTSVAWNISKVANDFSGSNVHTYLNTQTIPMQHFTVPGKYLVELNVNTAGPTGGNPCQLQLFDTINIVDTVVQISVNDTTVCAYNPVTFSFNGKGGQPPYTYRLFYAPDTSMFPLNGPFYGSTTYTFNPANSSRYIVQVRDINGCRGYDSSIIITAQKPVIGNILGPKNLSTISSPVIYFISPQVNNAIFWKVSGGTFLSGQTTDSISVQWLANGTGNVSVKVTDTKNCYDSTNINVSVNVGLKEITVFSNLAVYPNPTTGLLNIEFETSEKNIEIEVLDLIGKLMMKNSAKHNGGLFQKTLDISHLHEGIYFIKIIAGEKNTTVKVTLK